MNHIELADAIVGLANDWDWVTHGDMCNRFGDVVRGDFAIELPEKNIVFYVGASRALADAVHLLKSEKPQRVFWDACHYLCHFVDGGPIPTDMPWVKRPPKGGYKKPHFASVALRPISKRNTA